MEPTGAVPGGTYAGQGALGGIGEGEFPYLRPARLYSAPDCWTAGHRDSILNILQARQETPCKLEVPLQILETNKKSKAVGYAGDFKSKVNSKPWAAGAGYGVKVLSPSEAAWLAPPTSSPTSRDLAQF